MRTKILSVLALSAVVLGSCNNDTEVDNINNEATVSFTTGLDRFTTRVNNDGNAWLTTDRIGIYMFANGSLANGDALSENVVYQPENAGRTTSLQPTNSDEAILYPKSGTVEFMAYSPYSQSLSEFTYPISLANQSAGLGNFDLVYATANNEGGGFASGGVDFAFNHALSRFVLQFIDENNDFVSINNLKILGMKAKADFNLRTKEITNYEDGEILPYFDELNHKYAAIVCPSTDLLGYKVQFTYDNKEYTWEVSSHSVDGGAAVTQFIPNHAYTFVLKIATIGDVTGTAVEYGSSISDWQDGVIGGGTPSLKPEPLTINNSDALLALGYGEKIAIDYTVEGAVTVTSWASDNADIAVNNDGIITESAKSAATATITATLSDEKTKEISVKVAMGRLAYTFGNDIAPWYVENGATISSNTSYTTVTMGGDAKYRGDFCLIDPKNAETLQIDPSTYSILAVKVAVASTLVGGNNSAGAIKLDMHDANMENFYAGNSNNTYKVCDGDAFAEENSDPRVIYYELNGSFIKNNAEYYDMTRLKFVFADFTATNTYDIYWVRTFKNLEELQNFVANN